MFDLERAIAGLPKFEERCPLQISVLCLGHSGSRQIIVFEKKKKQENVISLCAKSSEKNILVYD